MGISGTLEQILAELQEMSKDPATKARYEEWEKDLDAGRKNDLTRRSGIPRKFLMSNFSNFTVTAENRAARCACWEYCENWDHDPTENRSLLLLGNIGTGKSHLAAAVCYKLIEDHLVRVKYANVLHTFTAIKMSFQSGKESPRQQLYDTPFLVLDDLGSQRPTDWATEELLDIVNNRWAKELPVMVTSNANSWEGLLKLLTARNLSHADSYSQDTMQARRIVDRLRDMTGDPLVLGGKSWRGRKAGSTTTS